jgi:ABC-type transport system substrate-binding protein
MRRLLWPVVLPAALLLLAGCQGNFSKQSIAENARIFRYPLVHDPKQMDPATVQYGDVIDLTQQIFEGLVNWGEDSQVHPNLAESWDISKDRTVYTFHLKKGIKFSNGKPVTAADFKWSIERACNPGLRSETAVEYMGDILGVADMRNGTATSVRGVTVVDDNTLKIQIDKPRPYFLGKLTYPTSWVVSKDACKPDKEMLSVDEMVGTGPFIATRFVEDQVFTLKANKDYHDGAPLIDGIERPILKDAATRLNMYKQGQVDLVQLELQDVAGLKNDATYKGQLHFYPRPATWYIAFNFKTYAPFAKREVRQAFAMAVNCKDIVEKTLGGVNDVADGILPPSVLGHRANAKMLGFDPVKAKQLLAQAGYADPSQMPPLGLYYRNDREDAKLCAQAVESDLRTNLGITVKLQGLDPDAIEEMNNKKQVPFMHFRWAADYLDPQDFLSDFFTTTGEENKMWYSNPQVDALCGAADGMDEKDPARLAKYAEAEDLILQDAGWLPIYFQKDVELISPRVQGLRDSVFGHLPHTKVHLDAVAPAASQ